MLMHSGDMNYTKHYIVKDISVLEYIENICYEASSTHTCIGISIAKSIFQG